MRALIKGWKSNLEVQPITLMSLLRDSLEIDLQAAKGLLDEFAEAGELIVSGERAILEHLRSLGALKGIEVVLLD
jgi:hypothetical protein